MSDPAIQTPPAIAAESQRAATDQAVELFILDATKAGQGIIRFVACTLNAFPSAASVVWNGNTFAPIPATFTNMMTGVGGTLPTPKLRVANVNLAFSAVIEAADLRGSTLTRIRTFVKYLDGQAQADPGKIYAPDIFRIESRAAHNNVFVEWNLAAACDQEGRMLPARQIHADYCDRIYRRWDQTLAGGAGAYVYDTSTDNPCPYVGAAMFDQDGNPTDDPRKDVAAKTVRLCCLKRFAGQPLPFGGFPGVARL